MKRLQFFRKVALLEGLSLIILVGICVPLKHFADTPEPVKVVGWLHGLLFILYVGALFLVWRERNWKFGRVVIAGIVSLVPFGTIVFDRSLKREVEQG